MDNFKAFIIAIIFSLLGALAHERDIYVNCSEKGISANSMWTANIECKPIMEQR